MFLCLLLIICMNAMIVFDVLSKRHHKHPVSSSSSSSTMCTRDTCGAIDPVNEPAYNMQNIVKQSILLEEHLAEKNKYCKSCIVKHFMHIIGLSEEAIWLAGSNVDTYPFLKDSPHFYQSLLDDWLSHKDDAAHVLTSLNTLRERRRQLIDVYFLSTPQ